MERVEKALVTYGIVTETQMTNQCAEITDQESLNHFIDSLRSRTESEQFRLQVKFDFLKFSQDDTWYELYKSITNEKDMAEKDQQRMIRRERRKIKRRMKLRKERLAKIKESLKIRAEYRVREEMRLRSNSVDRYHDYTDRNYE